jgi:hypothetical protein
MSQQSTGHRKRKREDHAQSIIEQAHMIYSDDRSAAPMLPSLA